MTKTFPGPFALSSYCISSCGLSSNVPLLFHMVPCFPFHSSNWTWRLKADWPCVGAVVSLGGSLVVADKLYHASTEEGRGWGGPGTAFCLSEGLAVKDPAFLGKSPLPVAGRVCDHWPCPDTHLGCLGSLQCLCVRLSKKMPTEAWGTQEATPTGCSGKQHWRVRG